MNEDSTHNFIIFFVFASAVAVSLKTLIDSISAPV